MQKIITSIFLLILFGNDLFAVSKHLSELNKAFPFALLTEDYSILNRDDLEINSCHGDPEEYTEKESNSPYPVWQCLETKDFRMLCSGHQIDDSTKKRFSLKVLKAKINGVHHEFIGRRFLDLSDCAETRKDINKLLKNEKYVCISGSGKCIDEKEKVHWIWDRIKTKKGCESYFVGHCSLGEMKKTGNCNP